MCVLGSEVLYFLCLLGELLPWRTGRAIEIHHALFETLPGFIWLTFGSFLLGVVYMFAFAWIFAWYMVWMHNTSLVRDKE